MTHQAQLDLYELHTARRRVAGVAGVAGRSPAAVARGAPAGVSGGRRRRPKNSPHLVRPLEHHAQEPNIPFRGIPHFDEQL